MTTSTLSILAYRAFAPRDLSKRQNTVLAFLLRQGPMSNKQLAERTGWPINTITPRVKELRDMGLVDDHQRDNRGHCHGGGAGMNLIQCLYWGEFVTEDQCKKRGKCFANQPQTRQVEP